MKFSHFENEKGEKTKKAFLPLYQVLGDGADDFYAEVEIDENQELVLKLVKETQENIDKLPEHYREALLSEEKELEKELGNKKIIKFIEGQYEFYNFQSNPEVYDDVYLISQDKNPSKMGAIIFGEKNIENLAKTEDVLKGNKGLDITCSEFGEDPIELPIELSKKIIDNIRELFVTPGKEGSPRDIVSISIVSIDNKFIIDGDIIETFFNGSVIYNQTLNRMWKWEDSLHNEIINSEPFKQKKQNFLNQLGL